MPTYRITSPDGKTLRVTAPEGASMDQVLSYAKSNYKPTPQGQQVYNEQAGPPKVVSDIPGFLFSGERTVEDPSGNRSVQLTEPVVPGIPGTDSIVQGVKGGARNLATGIARVPFDFGPKLLEYGANAAVGVPGLFGLENDLATNAAAGVADFAQGLQPGADRIAQGISNFLPPIQQNTFAGEVAQGATQYGPPALMGAGLVNNPVAKAGMATLADFLATDPSRATTIGDTFGGPTNINEDDSAATKRGKVAGENLAAGVALNPAIKAAAPFARGAYNAIGSKVGLKPIAEPISSIQKELGDSVNRNADEFANSQAAIEKLNKSARNLGLVKEGEQGFQPTVGQLTNDPGLLSQEERLLASQKSDEKSLYQQSRKNEQLLENVNRAQAQTVGAEQSDLGTYGERVKQRLAPETTAKRVGIETPVVAQTKKLDDTVTETTQDAIPVSEAGVSVKDRVLTPLTETMREDVRGGFRQANEMGMKTIEGETPNYVATLEKQAQQSEESLAPSLTQKTYKEAASDLQKIKPEEVDTTPVEKPTGLVDTEGRPITKTVTPEGEPPKTSTLENIQNTLSVLKTAGRKAKLSTEPGVDPKNYGERIAALTADEDKIIDDALSSDLGDEYKDVLEGARGTRRQIAVIENPDSPTGRVIRDAVDDRAILPTLLDSSKDKEGVKVFLDILDRPEFSSGKETARQGLADIYQQTVVKNGKVNPAAHEKFVRQYGEAGARLWGDKWSRVSSIGNMKNELTKLEDIRDKALKNFNDLIQTRIDTIAPEKVYSTIASKNIQDRLAMTRAYKLAISKTQPDLWNEFVALRRNEILAKMRGTGKRAQKILGTNKPTLDENRLSAALDDPEQVKEMTLLFGDDYVNSLRDFNDGLNVFRRKFLNVDAPSDASAATKYAARSAKTIFGYFGATGRAITFAEKQGGEQLSKTMQAVLEDPDSVKKIAQLLKNPYSLYNQKRNVNLLLQKGLIEPLREDDKPVQQPPK